VAVLEFVEVVAHFLTLSKYIRSNPLSHQYEIVSMKTIENLDRSGQKSILSHRASHNLLGKPQRLLNWNEMYLLYKYRLQSYSY
jgi:hypothetical protein